MKGSRALQLVQKEILGEKANSLGLTAEQFNRDLEEIARIEALIERASEGERAELSLKHEHARGVAEDRRNFLIIQREAIGLRDHRVVYATYIIPPKLR